MAKSYQGMLDTELEKIRMSASVSRLLLHACCAPCSSYVLSYLGKYFDITVFYYNPNIFPHAEYEKRAGELEKLLGLECLINKVDLHICQYEAERFQDTAKRFSSEPEGGKRCAECFKLRLEKTARHALDNGFDYYATTLTVSPHKNAALINDIGVSLQEKYGGNLRYLCSDFKKRDGYKRSIELSRELGLYRQDYCGCVFSMTNR